MEVLKWLRDRLALLFASSSLSLAIAVARKSRNLYGKVFPSLLDTYLPKLQELTISRGSDGTTYSWLSAEYLLKALATPEADANPGAQATYVFPKLRILKITTREAPETILDMLCARYRPEPGQLREQPRRLLRLCITEMDGWMEEHYLRLWELVGQSPLVSEDVWDKLELVWEGSEDEAVFTDSEDGDTSSESGSEEDMEPDSLNDQLGVSESDEDWLPDDSEVESAEDMAVDHGLTVQAVRQLERFSFSDFVD